MPKVAVPTDFHTTDAVRLQGDLEKLARSVRALSLVESKEELPALPVVGDMAVLADTAALFRFSGNLLDSSPNGANLAALSGVPRYTELLPGHGGLFLRSGDRMRSPAANACAIVGNLTVEWLWNYAFAPAASNGYIAYWSDTTGTPAGNALWGVEVGNTGEDLRWFHRQADGLAWQQYLLSGFTIPPGVVSHVAVTRSSNVIQFYLNGAPLGPPSSALLPTANGSASRLTLGGATHPAVTFGQIRISNTARSAAAIKQAYNETLGLLYGQRS